MDNTPIINSHNKQEYPPMHTAEHLLNGLIATKYGQGRAFSAHVESKKSKLDFHLHKSLDDSDIREIEATINSIIAEDIPVSEEYITHTEAKKRFDMSRLPNNASDTLRVIKIGTHDECLCAGSHVVSTGEIGKFRITSTRYVNGVQRIVFKLE